MVLLYSQKQQQEETFNLRLVQDHLLNQIIFRKRTDGEEGRINTLHTQI